MSNYKSGDSCPICGTGRLAEKVIDETFEYKGHSITVSGYAILECSACEEAIVEPASSRKATRILKEFNRSVDGLLSSAEIKRIRKNVGLTQEGMAEICGGGKKGFARYESGQVVQSKGMDNLLRIIDRFPYVLSALLPLKNPMTNVISLVDFRIRNQYRQAIGQIAYKEGDDDSSYCMEQSI